ncbi:MAG: hypothetical protein ACK40V_02640 [Anaerolineales bacterium]
MIQVDIIRTLEFYDEKISSSLHHATAINAIAGEDIGAGLFLHYLKQKNIVGEILPYLCTQGTTSGVRLDKWICATKNGKKIYYQTEIKNWSAHAFGGKRLMINASQNEISRHKIERWNKFWDGKTLTDPQARKVLTLMKLPEKVRRLSENLTIEPLICFWDSMHPYGKKEPFFFVDVKNKNFSRLGVFSMSAYLRNILSSGEKTITIEMYDTEARIDWLKKMFRIK